MTFFKKAMTYLGLGPDDDYDEYDVPALERPARRAGYADDPSAVRSVPSRPQGPPTATRPPPMPGEEPAIQIRGTRPGANTPVRPVPAVSSARPHTVTPRRFDQAQEVADKYKQGQPVIVNLQNIDRDLSRRLIDFASGLCYGLDGAMEKVAQGVYLLTPANVSVSPEDRRAITANGGDA
jgi:cell division inhibitor SepF